MSELFMMREAFGKIMVEMGKENKRIVVVDADLANSTKSSYFAAEFPQRFFQAGVAEQNMIGIAAGLSYTGFIPFAVTYASFLKRGLDQIRVLIAQAKANVKLIACYSGLCSGLSGKTHQSVQDLAIMRSMPNVKVIAPLDNVEMENVLRVISSDEAPAYVRIVRGPTSAVFSEKDTFIREKAVPVRHGSDLTLISTGTQTALVLEAAEILKSKGIDAAVLHVSWLKPLDEAAIVKAAKSTGVIVTVEEHTIIGGLGSAVTEVLSEYFPVPVKRLGISDRFGQTGSYKDLMEEFRLSPLHIASQAAEFLKAHHRTAFLPKKKAGAEAAAGV